MTTIEVRNLKIAAFASEETLCFEAAVYIDGQKAGTASNRGHGGCNEYWPRELEDRLNAHANTLPAEVVRWGKSTLVMSPDADSVIDRLVQDADLRKKFDRDIKAKIVFYRPSDCTIHVTKRMQAERITQLLCDGTWLAKQMSDGFVVLNGYDREQAFDLYRKGVEPDSNRDVRQIPNTWGRAWDNASRMMREAEGLEPTSALKQAASDAGIPEGEAMREFVEWAHLMIEGGAL